MTQTTQQSGLQVIPIQVLLQAPHLTTSVNSTVCSTNFIELQAIYKFRTTNKKVFTKD